MRRMAAASRWRIWLVAVIVSALLIGRGHAQEISSKAVLESIERAKTFLLKAQRADGSWGEDGSPHRVGISSLAMLALINSGMTVQDKEIQRGLNWLREPAQAPTLTYEISLMIQAFAAAKDGKRDTAKVLDLVRKLEESQLRGQASTLR